MQTVVRSPLDSGGNVNASHSANLKSRRAVRSVNLVLHINRGVKILMHFQSIKDFQQSLYKNKTSHKDQTQKA